MRSAFWTRRRVQPVTRAIITARLIWQLPHRQIDFERELVGQVTDALDNHGRAVNDALRHAFRRSLSRPLPGDRSPCP